MILSRKIRLWDAMKNSVLHYQRRWNDAVGKSLEDLTHRDCAQPTFIKLWPRSTIRKSDPAYKTDRRVQYHDVRTQSHTSTVEYISIIMSLKMKNQVLRNRRRRNHAVDKSKKNPISQPRKSKKSNLTIDLLSLGIYAPGPQVLTYRPQILRGVRI